MAETYEQVERERNALRREIWELRQALAAAPAAPAIPDSSRDPDDYQAGYDAGYLAGRKCPAIPEDVKRDAEMLDWLDETAQGACVTTCFEMDGGVHLTIEAPSVEPVGYRNQNSVRDAIAAAMAASGAQPEGGEA